MGNNYLRQGKIPAFFVHLNGEPENEFNRLYYIFKRTKSKRIKRKIAKRIDALVWQEWSNDNHRNNTHSVHNDSSTTIHKQGEEPWLNTNH